MPCIIYGTIEKKKELLWRPIPTENVYTTAAVHTNSQSVIILNNKIFLKKKRFFFFSFSMQLEYSFCNNIIPLNEESLQALCNEMHENHYSI